MNDLPHIDTPPETEAEWFDALVRLARYLRSPQGCPWDRRQSGQSFASFSQEETAELVEAYEENDNDHIAEEFGDVLFTLLASAAAAESEGRFVLRDALARTHEKMIRRHGHVFGDEAAESPQEAADAWNRVKAQERVGKTRRP